MSENKLFNLGSFEMEIVSFLNSLDETMKEVLEEEGYMENENEDDSIKKMKQFRDEANHIIEILGEVTEEIKKEHKPFVFCYSLSLYSGYIAGVHADGEPKDTIARDSLIESFDLGFALGKEVMSTEMEKINEKIMGLEKGNENG